MTQEALKLALEALESCDEGDWSTGHVIHPSYDEDAVAKAITAIKEALAQTQDAKCKYCTDGCPACDARKLSAQRTWVGLTDDDELDWEEGSSLKDLVKAIEAKLKQKNGFAEEKNT